jgi:hypothetical protein
MPKCKNIVIYFVKKRSDLLKRQCCDCICLALGSNLPIASYNASVVKTYNTANRHVRFKNEYFSLLKNTVAYYNAGVVVVHKCSGRRFESRIS